MDEGKLSVTLWMPTSLKRWIETQPGSITQYIVALLEKAREEQGK